MNSIRKHNSLLSLVLLLSLFGFFSYKSSTSVGISSYSQAFLSLEKAAFFDIYKKNRIDAARMERRIKSQIQEVMQEYNANLKGVGLTRISDRIFDESRKYGYDPLLLTALIVTESSFNNRAKSHRGALGLMQIRPATGSALALEAQIFWEGKPTLYNPDHNITLGALYLNKLLRRFKDMRLALEAYNHGPSQLSRYLRQGKNPKKYSRKVIEIYSQIRSDSI